MNINEVGLNIIKKYEGLRLKQYICPAGKLTIGYGHVIAKDENFTEVTEPQANELLARDIRVFEVYVKSIVKSTLNENQFSSLVSFCYNLGFKALKESTLLNKVNEELHLEVPSEFIKWVNVGDKKYKGLIKRRLEEARLYMEF